MRKEEYSKLPQDLQKKFHDWFGDSVPTALPSPTEADHSIRVPAPAVLPLPTDADPINRRRVDDLQNLFWL